MLASENLAPLLVWVHFYPAWLNSVSIQSQYTKESIPHFAVMWRMRKCHKGKAFKSS